MCSKECYDKMVIQLKIISQIQEDDKLYISSDQIEIQKPSLHTSLNRWYNNQTRKKLIDYLDKIMTDVYTRIYTYASFPQYKDYSEQTIQELSNSLQGLRNLKKTYEQDEKIVSKLQLMIEEAEKFIRNIYESKQNLF